jgi:hypothetical protein
MTPRALTAAATMPALLAALASCTPAPAAVVGQDVPSFEVDPAWPPIMPKKWIIGEVRGMHVDARDHVWVIHRPGNLTDRELAAASDPPEGECCVSAPSVVELDTLGNVVQAWGAPPGGYERDIEPWRGAEGYKWPFPEHGIYVDHEDFVWVGANEEHHALKFTRDGKHVLTIGGEGPGQGTNDVTRLGGPAGFAVDPETNEVFIADGYINHRVIVFDAATGAYKRHWGAYGEKPEDYERQRYDPSAPPSRQLSNVHGIFMSKDRLVYVADRSNNRIQVFRPSGEFIMERIVAPETRASGSASNIAASADPQQTWLYLVDSTNNKIWILRRSDLEIVGSFGHAGRQAGRFFRVHGIGVDSRGNVYTGEAGDGKRVQKFRLVAPPR